MDSTLNAARCPRKLLWALLLLMCVLTGCASVPRGPRPAESFAHAPRAESPFARIEQAVSGSYGADQSGFRLLQRNEDALHWRLALIDSAKHSLDLQYYVWFGDKAGELLMARVIAAASRGVRVRVLFDDLNTLLHDMDSIELRDARLAQIDRNPNIEIRVFNAWRERSLVGRAFESVGDFGRLNRRMHNKQMIVDNRVAVIGGRNIGDEYLGLNEAFNFHDLDVMGVGPVARQASAVFDRYWNSDWVRAIPKPESSSTEGGSIAPSVASAIALAEVRADERGRALLAGRHAWGSDIERLLSMLKPGMSVVHTDSPSRSASTRNHMPEAFRALMRSAEREVLITNAYIIPDANFMADLRELDARGVRVRILTNSLESHDVPAVNSHYENWRRPILETGAELFELRADAALRARAADTPPVQSKFVGLHTKAMVIDRKRSFVGSMNLDSRSEIINSEMGVLIDSQPLAQALAILMEGDFASDNSWRVSLQGDGVLLWTNNRTQRSSQPARNLWQRVENMVFKLFPPDLY
jgi:cardiolipin synthase C